MPAQVGVKKPGPADIPQRLVSDIGLAGDPRPDIARFPNVRSVDSSSLSPDGQRLAFVTRTTGQPQLWVVDVAGGAPWQVTFRDESVTFQDWSPAGGWIAYGTDQNGNEREGYYLVSPDGLQERALLAPTDAFRRWGGWSPDGRQIAFASTERNKIDFDIYVMDVGANGSHGAPRRVHEGKGAVYVAGWRPDGRALLLTPKRGEADNDVYLLDLTSSELKRIFQPSNAANYSSFAWTPDARGFYVVTNQDRDLSGLAHYNAMDGRLSWIETPTAEVEHAALSSDGRYLAWTVNDNGYSCSMCWTCAGICVLRPIRHYHGACTASIASGSRRRAQYFGLMSATRGLRGTSGSSMRKAVRNGAQRRPRTGGLDPGRFVVPDAVSFTSWDGETVHGLLYLPPALPQRVSPPGTSLLSMVVRTTKPARSTTRQSSTCCPAASPSST